MIGRGKYDDLCEGALFEADADGVLLIVLGGRLGSGFSVTFRHDAVQQRQMEKIPAVLREMANQIEADMKGLKKQ